MRKNLENLRLHVEGKLIGRAIARSIRRKLGGRTKREYAFQESAVHANKVKLCLPVNESTPEKAQTMLSPTQAAATKVAMVGPHGFEP
ncbi:hypothetical protein [Ahniella affigens]|uniref:hypothetical protein n=1 Tax=Ahniella affigens TaxID=2021234 RepID=UPI0011B2585A|nr:hypothetical protein [Ahniella affigens]